MEANPDIQPANRTKLSKVLRIITSVYAVLYLALLVSYLFEPDPFGSVTPEGVFVIVAFIVFIIGYYLVWKNEGIAGVVFIVWYGIMWYLGWYVAETDRGVAGFLGFPMLIIGILFFVSWYRNRVRGG